MKPTGTREEILEVELKDLKLEKEWNDLTINEKADFFIV
jgi:hypothetical protein